MSGAAHDKKRVLIIAEAASPRSRMETVFAREGYAVLSAEHSLDVLALVDQHAPHVIVLHAEAPSELALEALEPLRKRHPRRDVPAVVLSADETLILDCGSHSPRVLSDRPLAPDDVLAHVAQLTCCG